jgi:hypothetical protein
MRMFPMRTSSIFKSRWMALIWAAGILWLAYDFAESAPQPSAPTNQQSDDEKQAAEVLNTL